MYTVSQKTSTVTFCHNFGKYRPIVKIISLLHSQRSPLWTITGSSTSL